MNRNDYGRRSIFEKSQKKIHPLFPRWATRYEVDKKFIQNLNSGGKRYEDLIRNLCDQCKQ